MAQQAIYSWQSPTGVVEETGGTLEHINQNGLDKRNVARGAWHTFVLNGDYHYINMGYNVDDCSYMRITLADGNTFRKGDEIEITAMRDNQHDRPASIYFLFHTTKRVPRYDASGKPVEGFYDTLETDVPLVGGRATMAPSTAAWSTAARPQQPAHTTATQPQPPSCPARTHS